MCVFECVCMLDARIVCICENAMAIVCWLYVYVYVHVAQEMCVCICKRCVIVVCCHSPDPRSRICRSAIHHQFRIGTVAVTQATDQHQHADLCDTRPSGLQWAGGFIKTHGIGTVTLALIRTRGRTRIDGIVTTQKVRPVAIPVGCHLVCARANGQSVVALGAVGVACGLVDSGVASSHKTR